MGEPPSQNVAVAGEYPLQEAPKYVLLVSRLPRRIVAEDAWLKAVRRALTEVTAQGGTLVCGEGLTGWDYTAWYAGRCGMQIFFVLTPARLTRLVERKNELCRRLDLDQRRISFVMPIASGRLNKEQRLHLRDGLAFALAKHRLPIALRPQSFWRGLLNRTAGVDCRFETVYPLRPATTWHGLTPGQAAEKANDRLYHWTRGFYGPWPGETEADYYRELTASASGNPRDGLATLARIVLEGVLRGEARMNRGGAPVLSFTALSPAVAARQARYRPTLGRWNYEPYGLSFPRELLENLSARPVIYGSRDDYHRLAPSERPYFQFVGRGGKTDWSEEKEWRLVGDLDLRSIREQVYLWAPTRIEAERLTRLTGYPVNSLTG